MVDQVTIDYKISALFPDAIPGQMYLVNGQQMMYKGADKIQDMIDDLSMKHPDMINKANAAAMLADPLGFKPPTFQLDPAVVKGITALNTASKATGLASGIAGAAGLSGAADVLGDAANALNGAAIGGLTGALGAGSALGGAAGALGGAIGGGLSSLTGLAKSFVPPGLDGPMEAMKGAMGAVTAGIPGLPGGVGAAASGAHNIAGQISSVKGHLTAQVKGPAALLFKAVNSNLLSDIPGADALKNVVNLQSQVAGLAGLASNPIAFAAKAAQISQQFPMINVNAIANKMIGGVASGAGINLNTMIPNMNLAGGVMKMLPIPGKTPTANAIKPQKTANPAKPVKPLQMKNLFAEAAAGGTLATLTQPLSAFMGMMSTIAPQTNLISAGPAKTSYGEQKLTSNANTVNWGAGGYGRNEALAAQEKKRLELTAKIEKHMAELEQMTDYSKLTSMSYADMKKKYPQIKANTTVAEALHIIDQAEKASKAITNA
jgi:hypothetical protein